MHVQYSSPKLSIFTVCGNKSEILAARMYEIDATLFNRDFGLRART